MLRHKLLKYFKTIHTKLILIPNTFELLTECNKCVHLHIVEHAQKRRESKSYRKHRFHFN